MTRTENLNFIWAQLTIASWYLGRAVQGDGGTSSYYLYHARQAYDIAVQLLPNVTLDEQSQGELSVFRERLRAAESASRSVDGAGTSSRPRLGDSSP
jgi:hypothetical protein